MSPKTNADLGERVAQLEAKHESIFERLESIAGRLEGATEKLGNHKAEFVEFRGRILGALVVVGALVPLVTAVVVKVFK